MNLTTASAVAAAAYVSDADDMDTVWVADTSDAQARDCVYNYTSVSDASGAYELTVAYPFGAHTNAADLWYEADGFIPEASIYSCNLTWLSGLPP
jgi:hypothetical protein